MNNSQNNSKKNRYFLSIIIGVLVFVAGIIALAIIAFIADQEIRSSHNAIIRASIEASKYIYEILVTGRKT